MVDFVRCMQNRQLLQNGDYIIISVDDEIYDSKRRVNIMERSMFLCVLNIDNKQCLTLKIIYCDFSM